MNTYKREGYDDRQAYLFQLADDTGVDIKTVMILAELLGQNEDFDGLVTALEDYACNDGSY